MSDLPAGGGLSPLVRLVSELLAQLEGTPGTECEFRAGQHHISLRRSPTLAPGPGVPAPAEEERVPGHWQPIAAPLAGVFYGTERPQAPPFVSIGSRVLPGQTVGLIESMKMYNPVESEIAGTVRAILVANATVVEAGQVLIYLEPQEEPA